MYQGEWQKREHSQDIKQAPIEGEAIHCKNCNRAVRLLSSVQPIMTQNQATSARRNASCLPRLQHCFAPRLTSHSCA
jgi:hypothetical protein